MHEGLECGSMHCSTDVKPKQKAKNVMHWHHKRNNENMNDLDNHVDACVVSPDTTLIVADCEAPIAVSGCSDHVGRITCHAVTGVMAHDEHNGKTWHPHCHQVLETPGL